MSRLTRDLTAEPILRDQILRRIRGQGNIIFIPCSADHKQDWQPYPVDSYSAIRMYGRIRGQGNIIFIPCSAEHKQDWQPYPVDTYSAICDDHTYVHT